MELSINFLQNVIKYKNCICQGAKSPREVLELLQSVTGNGNNFVSCMCSKFIPYK